jgi:hypothetical protein
VTKLTTYIRENLSKDLLKHRFGDAAASLVADRAAFALKVYNDIYSEADRKKMAALPEGWLGKDSDITVQFGDGRGYGKLEFSGSVYGDVHAVLKEPVDTVYRLVIHQHLRGCAKAYERTHEFAAEYDALRERQKDLSTQISLARRQTEAALTKATTLKRLVDIWPEIEPFVEKYIDKPKPLPALPTNELNALLDLPVSEAA